MLLGASSPSSPLYLGLPVVQFIPTGAQLGFFGAGSRTLHCSAWSALEAGGSMNDDDS